MKQHMQEMLLGSLSALGRTPLPGLFRPFHGGCGSILALHRVVPRQDRAFRIKAPLDLELTPESLDELILFIRGNGYDIISLDEMWNRLRTGQSTRRFVVITFDDGYKDNLTYAYPILKKHRVPFAIYIIASWPEGRHAAVTNLVEEIVLVRENVRTTVGNREYIFETGTQQQKQISYSRIRELLHSVGIREAEEACLKMAADCGIDMWEYSSALGLSWSDIRKLADDDLVTIGAHTFSHRPLSHLPVEEARQEIQVGRRLLEQHTGSEALHFSYPYGGAGQAGPREFALVRGEGFRTAVTTRTANVFRAHGKHPHALPRLVLGGSCADTAIFRLLLSGMPSAFLYPFRRVVTGQKGLKGLLS